MTDLTPLTRFAARGTLWPGVRGWHVTHGVLAKIYRSTPEKKTGFPETSVRRKLPNDKRIPDDELISKIKHALSRALVPVL